MNAHKGRHIFWIVFSGMLSLISACNNYSVSEEQAESFLKYYAVDFDNHTGTDLIRTSDGGYAILCNYDNGSAEGIFVILTDEFGRQKTNSPYVIATPGVVQGYGMIEIDDGYLISGSVAAADSIKGYLVVISGEGRILREKKVSGYRELEFRDAYEAKDGNLIVTGYGKNDADNRQVILVKTTTELGLIWPIPRRFPWSGNNVGEAVIEHLGRYHILTTTTDVNSPRLSQIRMLNTNTDGRGPTHHLISTPYLSGKDIAVNDASGNMYILGNLEDNSSRKSSIFLAELVLTGQDNSITSLANPTIIPDDKSLYGASFVTLEDYNELAIGGRQIDDNLILFLRVDNDFQVLTRKIYGFKSAYQASQSIIHTSDGGFALTGSVDMVDKRTSMLLKIDSEGELK